MFFASVNSDMPYTMPKLTALEAERIWLVTSDSGTP